MSKYIITVDDSEDTETVIDQEDLILTYCTDKEQGDFGVMIFAEDPDTFENLIASIAYNSMRFLSDENGLSPKDAKQALQDIVGYAVEQAYDEITKDKRGTH